MMFDRSLLAPARLEFVVVADTHYVIDVGDVPLEFESRRVQGIRADTAWQAISALEPEFVVHMGDLVQEFPGRPNYKRAVHEAVLQIEKAGLADHCRFVVGNHDVGDKPDSTMPTHPVSAAELEGWHDRHGPSWRSWEAGGIRFISLNSQILNTDMVEATQQRAWFEACLADLGDRAGVLFIHLPPYLRDPQEPHRGHYDNIGEPDRSWLLDLVNRHRIVTMFAAHVHFQFYDHIPGSTGPCRYRVTPSSSFTRPGFSHLFTSAAPPEQGRNDVGKLGFFYCRVPDDGSDNVDVHRVRMSSLPTQKKHSLLTPVCTPRDSPEGFTLGVTLRHPLAPTADVPVAWPSVIRQPVRNDYPLLSCVDIGARWVRVPITDLIDEVQSRRLELLRRDGARIQAIALGEEEALQHAETLTGIDRLELQLPGRLTPTADALLQLGNIALPLVLCPVLPGEAVAGKQHKRTRIGYHAEELDQVVQALDTCSVEAAVACRLDGTHPWDTTEILAQWHSRYEVVFLCEMPGVDDMANAAAVARATLAAARLHAALFLDPLIDLDRTMDVSNGLLDTLCNPRLAFDSARCLAALLAAHDVTSASFKLNSPEGCEVATSGSVTLIIPAKSDVPLTELLDRDTENLRVCQLSCGLVADLTEHCFARAGDGPLLVYPANPV